MVFSVKALLYKRLFSIAPRIVREYYFRTKTLVPIEELTQKYIEALAYLKKKGPVGDYLEFGVFRGDSLVCMHKALGVQHLDSVRLFGFDSFEGLPDITNEQDKSLPWQKGEYISTLETTKRNLDRAGVDWKRVFLTKGFFSTTLMSKLLKKYKIKKASMIMIDCDLYSSAKEALVFCVPLIVDSAIIFFDDWTEDNAGERKAFNEILAAYPRLKAREFGTYIHVEQKVPYTSKIFLVTRTPN